MYNDDVAKRQNPVGNDINRLVEKDVTAFPAPFKSPTYQKMWDKYIITMHEI